MGCGRCIGSQLFHNDEGRYLVEILEQILELQELVSKSIYQKQEEKGVNVGVLFDAFDTTECIRLDLKGFLKDKGMVSNCDYAKKLYRG